MKLTLLSALHRALLLLLSLAFAPTSRAGTWSTAAWTGDATSYIAPGQTVWAYHFDSTTTATVNGFAVLGIAGGSPAVPGSFAVSGVPVSIGFDHSNELTRAGLGGSAEMAKRFIYNGNPGSVTVESLTVGQTYTISIFGVDWSNGVRVCTFASGGDSLAVDEHMFGNERGVRVDYTFTATAATRTFTVTPVVPSDTWHFYGLALRQETAPTTVTHSQDSGTGSLRWALANAAAIPGADTITFDPSLSGATITTLTDLTVSDAGGVTIDASALAAPITITRGSAAHRLFTHTTGSLTLRRLRLENGIADAAAAIAPNLGGAVRSTGSAFAAFDCAIVNHRAGLSGGALSLSTSGASTIEGCTFSGNSTTADHGASGAGAAISNAGALTVRKSTFHGNSTFASATGPSAGAILNTGTLALEHCTVTDNTSGGSGARGAIFLGNSGGVSATITNCIIADNPAGTDVNNATGSASNLTYSGGNIVLTQANTLFTGPAPLTSAPVLSAFGANGGETDTRVPQFGSPAIDAASVIAGHSTDQRGIARPFDGDGDGTAASDLGAAEARFPIVSNGHDAGVGSLRQAVADAAIFPGPDTIVFRAASFPSGGTVNLSASLPIPAAGDTAGLTLLTTVSGGNVDVAVNAGTLSWGTVATWTGGGRVLLGATSGSDPATVELTGLNGFNVLAAPVVVRAGSSGTKTLRDSNAAAVLPNTFAGAITLLAPAAIEKLGSGPVNFASDVDLGAQLLSVSGTGNGPIHFSGRVFRGDGTGKAQLTHSGAGTVRFTGSGDNTRLALTVTSGSAEFSKTSSASVHAVGGGLTAADGPALTLGSGRGLICNGGDQIADTASVTLDGILSLTADETIDALNGTGSVQIPFGTRTLTIGAANGTGSFGGAFMFGSAIVKTGAGVQTLSGSNTNTAAVTISNGTLNITGTLPNVTATTVQTGATIAGTGTIGAGLTFESGSNFAPGDATVAASIGTLNFAGAATWNGGATARFHLSTTDNSADRLALGGTLTKGSAGSYTFDFQGTGVAGQTYPLTTFASSDFTASDFAYTGLAPGLVGYFTKSATSLTFTVSAFNPSVTSTADSGPGSLRQVLDDAAHIPGANTISFPASLSGATIALSSEVVIDDATGGVTLDGSGLPAGLTLSGGGTSRIFHVAASSSVTLNALTLSSGSASSGGAISNAGSLVLNRCTLTKNSATSGGAIFNGGALTLTQCTLAENSAATGGALTNQGASATILLTHCTLARNTATSSGGAIAILNGDLAMGNTIVAGNTAPSGPDLSNLGSPIVAAGANIIGNIAGSSLTAGPTVLTGDPRLAPLAHYGGPTKTMALLPGSPALDPAANLAAALVIDQRGFPRSRNVSGGPGGIPDLGAYEAQVAPVSGVGFNFVGGGAGGPGGTLAAADEAGAPDFVQANWNNLSSPIDGTAHDGTFSGNGPALIVNARGTAMSPNPRLWWAADHLWNISNGVPGTANARLMNGYLDSNNGGSGRAATNLYASAASQPFFAVAGLPGTPGGYKVIVYTDGDANDRVGEYWLTTHRNANPASVASETELSPHIFARDGANFSGTYTRVPSTSTSDLGLSSPPGNYIVFEGLTDSGFIVRAEEAYVSAPLNAVQIVANEIVVVTTAADELDANGTLGTGLSLREALRDAPDGAGILFDSTLNGATIAIDANKGEMVLTKDVTIDASTLGSGVTITGGSNPQRIFTVAEGKSVSLVALTLSGGSGNLSNGGAILNSGLLNLTRCTLAGNTATQGGAIFSGGVARLRASHCTFAGNTATASGGGALRNAQDATATLFHCTISSNQAPGGQGGGIYAPAAGDSVKLIFSIVAGNTATTEPDISGAFVQTGANLTSGNPQLAALAANGGPTQTMALLAGSPARNAATGSTATNDQRGSPIVGVPDIGAYEANDTPNTDYSAWSLAVAGSVLPAADDTESDGASNALEYALRRNPLAHDATLNPTLTGPAGGRLFTFRYQPTARDLRYIVQRTTDLTNAGGWTEIYRFDLSTGVVTELFSVTGDENSTTQVITLTDPVPSATIFWRLRIELVP